MDGVKQLGMPGIIWVRDLMVGDEMVDRSFRVERLRSLGLWGAAEQPPGQAWLEPADEECAELEPFPFYAGHGGQLPGLGPLRRA
jgi:hypothetical protein